MQVIECVQGSDEWFEAKLGVISASNFSKVLSKGTGRGLYMRKLAAERLTGLREVEFRNKNTDRGNEIEAAAREYYSLVSDCIVEEVGFVKRDEDVGCSPDGLVGTCGSIEIKCPISSTHVANIINNKMPTEYRPQVQGVLWVTQRQWCDWISFDARVIAKPIQIVRVQRDVEYQKMLEEKIGLFVKRVRANGEEN
jgi:hypothetical protein